MTLTDFYSCVSRRQAASGGLDRSVIDAALRARQDVSCTRAIFGDCKDISKRTISLLEEIGVPARLVGGQFIANPAEDEEWDHSWVVVNGEILDPTVDQFFSSLDVDLETTVSGIYYSAIDGDWLRDRYRIRPW